MGGRSRPLPGPPGGGEREVVGGWSAHPWAEACLSSSALVHGRGFVHFQLHVPQLLIPLISGKFPRLETDRRIVP